MSTLRNIEYCSSYLQCDVCSSYFSLLFFLLNLYLVSKILGGKACPRQWHGHHSQDLADWPCNWQGNRHALDHERLPRPPSAIGPQGWAWRWCRMLSHLGAGAPASISRRIWFCCDRETGMGGGSHCPFRAPLNFTTPSAKNLPQKLVKIRQNHQ